MAEEEAQARPGLRARRARRVSQLAPLGRPVNPDRRDRRVYLGRLGRQARPARKAAPELTEVLALLVRRGLQELKVRPVSKGSLALLERPARVASLAPRGSGATRGARGPPALPPPLA